MRRYIAPVGAAVVILAVLSLTLHPVPVAPSGTATEFDLRDLRSVADAAANILLFVPVGVALALLRPGWRTVVLGSLALSVGIEGAQWLIPGRFPAVSDVVFNVAGAALGLVIVRQAPVWLWPEGRRAPIAAIAALLIALVVLTVAPLLFHAHVPVRALYGQWTAEFGDMETYGGEVLAAEVGGTPTPSRRLARSDLVRRLLLAGTPVNVAVRAGPAPAGLAPVFSIFDDRQQLVWLLGIDGEDLVLRYRMRATAAKLDQPDLRLEGALEGLKEGDLLLTSVERTGSTFCVRVGAARHCGFGFGGADGWSLLLYPVPRWLELVLPYLWVALLLVPAGFWSQRWPLAGVLALIAVTVLGLASRFTVTAPLTPGELMAAVLGLLSGQAIGRHLVSAFRPRAPES